MAALGVVEPDPNATRTEGRVREAQSLEDRSDGAMWSRELPGVGASYTWTMTYRCVAGLTAALALLTAGPLAWSASQPTARPEPLTSRETPEWARSFGGHRVFTQPCKDSLMGFAIPVEIKEVLSRSGDEVKKGTVLVRARDTEAEAGVRMQRLRASNDWGVKAAENELELAEIEFKAMEEIRGSGGTKQEYDRARITRDAAKIRLEAAKLALEEEKIRLERLEAELDRYRLTAPYDGVIESVRSDPGQAMGDSEPVLRLVDISKLWLDVNTPTQEVMQRALKPGDPAWIVMDLPGEPQVFLGKVVEVSPVADFPSQQLKVRVEVGNDKKRPAGLVAWVRFSPPSEEWMGRIMSQVAEGPGPEIATAAVSAAPWVEAEMSVGDRP